MNEHDIETATEVLAQCAAHDPWFPAASESGTLAWANAFATSGLSREDLLAGVAHAYQNAEEGFRPLAATIIRHARASYLEELAALPDWRRELMDEANHVLQDMNISPPDAHRFARMVALGRSTPFELTADQLADFRSRLAQRQLLDPDRFRALGDD